MKILLKYTACKKLFPLILLGAAALCLLGCDINSASPSVVEKIKEEGILHVVTYNSPVTYFEDRSSETGFEYELAKSFAKSLGVKLQVEQVSNLDEVYSRIAGNKQLLGAASLVETENRAQQVTFSSPYLMVDALVIYNKAAGHRPVNINDLIGQSILVIKGSSQADQLQQLRKQYPDLVYQESDAIDVIDLLQQVEDKKIDIAVVNSNVLAMTQVYYKNVRIGFTLATNQAMGWIVSRNDEDTSLVDAVNDFLTDAESNGVLARLKDRFFGHIDMLGYVGAYSFARHLQDRLPKYEQYFIEYAKQNNLDWKLLAAIGYQESHWNPDAISPTGVRGIMMLTKGTAKAMGVENRLDAQQSIRGGAKLLNLLVQNINKEIKDPDRIFFALAAYNMGQGHLMDVQKIAELNSLNSNVWRDVNQVLPLIAQKQWYKKTRYGYARGFETKQFVRNVRRYYDILNWSSYSQREATIELPELHIPALSHNDRYNSKSL